MKVATVLSDIKSPLTVLEAVQLLLGTRPALAMRVPRGFSDQVKLPLHSSPSRGSTVGSLFITVLVRSRSNQLWVKNELPEELSRSGSIFGGKWADNVSRSGWAASSNELLVFVQNSSICRLLFLKDKNDG